nr:hypothetical protein [Thiomonas arsenitoxydans]
MFSSSSDHGVTEIVVSTVYLDVMRQKLAMMGRQHVVGLLTVVYHRRYRWDVYGVFETGVAQQQIPVFQVVQSLIKFSDLINDLPPVRPRIDRNEVGDEQTLTRVAAVVYLLAPLKFVNLSVVQPFNHIVGFGINKVRASACHRFDDRGNVARLKGVVIIEISDDVTLRDRQPCIACSRQAAVCSVAHVRQ